MLRVCREDLDAVLLGERQNVGPTSYERLLVGQADVLPGLDCCHRRLQPRTACAQLSKLSPAVLPSQVHGSVIRVPGGHTVTGRTSACMPASLPCGAPRKTENRLRQAIAPADSSGNSWRSTAYQQCL
jgi:hypothetical protein